MNSRVLISGLDSPSQASRATWASWVVSVLLAWPARGPAGCGARLRTVWPVASSSRRARSANPPGPYGLEHLPGGAQLLACVRAAVVPAQPLAVEQLPAGQFGTDAGAAEAVDRLTVEPLGGLALAEQGGQAGLDPQRPVGGGHPGALGQPRQRGPEQCYVTGPGCRLGQLRHDNGPVPKHVVLEC